MKEGWLTKLVAAIEEHPADVAVPLIMEGRIGKGHVHFDDLLGTVQQVETPEGPKWTIHVRSTVKGEGPRRRRRTIEMMEQHCILFRRSALERMGPYDEEFNTRDEIDLSLALYHAGQKVVFEPQCEVHYLPPYPPEDDELDFFYMKWNHGTRRKEPGAYTREVEPGSVPGRYELRQGTESVRADVTDWK